MKKHLIILVLLFMLRISYCGILNKDDRVDIKNKNILPWSLLGTLTTKDTKVCTATLIGKCYIVTASHCVYGEDNKLISDLVFTHEKFLTKDKTYIKKTEVNITDIFAADFTKSKSNDWAIIKLKRNVGEQLGHMTVTNTSGFKTVEQNYTLAGFHADCNNGAGCYADGVKVYYNEVKLAAIDKNSRRFKNKDRSDKSSNNMISDNYIYFNADAFVGASGGPLFTKRASKYYIDAIFTETPVDIIAGFFLTNMHIKGDFRKEFQFLSRGVAAAEFYNKMKLFMRKKPCT